MKSATVNGNATQRARLNDIDSLRGILIVLVVFGHITLHSFPEDNDWYETTRTLVYQFHMPAFLFISGFVFYYTGKATLDWMNYRRFIADRAERLLIPYFAMAMIIITGKMIASHFVSVDSLPRSFFGGVMSIFGPNETSPVNSIWYLVVLFIYSVLTPLLMRLSNNRLEWITLLSIPLCFIDLPQDFYLWRSSHFFVFFLCGCVAAKHLPAYLAFIDRYRAALAIAAIAVLFWSDSYPRLSVTMLLVNLFTIPALHAICRIPAIENSSPLHFLSKYSMIIYLLNSICSGVLKGLILKFSTWDGAAFMFWAPVMVASGLIVPILCKRLFLDRVPYLRRLTS
jgi:fucose 4-O-acetylase-like acetyltransferase